MEANGPCESLVCSGVGCIPAEGTENTPKCICLPASCTNLFRQVQGPSRSRCYSFLT